MVSYDVASTVYQSLSDGGSHVGDGAGAAGDGNDEEEVEAEEAPRWAVVAALFALHATAAACAVQLEKLQLALDIIGATCGQGLALVSMSPQHKPLSLSS
jgi:hypothetical protein